MRITKRFGVIVGVLLLVIGLGAVVYNQFTLQNELNGQAKFDTQVMKNDQRIWEEFQKLSTESAVEKPTPTPTKKPRLIAS